jgi:hypothetical protein
MLPFKLGDAGLLGDIFQLAPGFVTLRLELESSALIVARGRVVVDSEESSGKAGFITTV